MRALSLSIVLASCTAPDFVDCRTDPPHPSCPDASAPELDADLPDADLPDADLPDAGRDAGRDGAVVTCDGTFADVEEIVELAGGDNWAPMLNAAEDEIYFVSSRGGGEGGFDIWVSTRLARSWRLPTPVAELNTSFQEDSPVLSRDGNTMWLASDRDGSFDVFISTRPDADGAWTEPVAVTELNTTTGSEMPAAVFDNDRQMLLDWHVSDVQFVTHSMLTGMMWGTAEPIVVAGDDMDRWFPFVDEARQRLYFSALNTVGLYRIWQSERAAGSMWGTPTALFFGKEPEHQGYPWLSGDACRLYFTGWDANKGGENYRLFLASN